MKPYWRKCTYATGLLLFCIFAVSYGVNGNITVSSNVNGRELPIYSVETDEKKVALTFDAAWGNRDNRKILDILKKHDVKATFFMTGDWVSSYPEDVKAIWEAGHDLGNHSDSHKNMSQLSEEEKTKELMNAHNKVEELTGVQMNLFRAPYGDYNDDVILNAKGNGYDTIQWNIDTKDWKDYGVKNIQDRVLQSPDLQNGSIILCHNGAKYTADALEGLITGLQERGYQLVPVSELIYRENYHMDVAGRQRKD